MVGGNGGISELVWGRGLGSGGIKSYCNRDAGWVRPDVCVWVRGSLIGTGSYSRAYKYITPHPSEGPGSPTISHLAEVWHPPSKLSAPSSVADDLHECLIAFRHELDQCTPLFLYRPQSCADAGAQVNHQNGAFPLEYACRDLPLTTYATHLSVPTRRLSPFPNPSPPPSCLTTATPNPTVEVRRLNGRAEC